MRQTGETRVLIVEDEELVAADLENRLQELGYVVPAIAGTGEEALRQVDALRPDLILMDIRLKGPMDGIAVAEQVRTRYNLPVVYLTKHADPITLQRAKLTAPYGYLLKPVVSDALAASIEMALHKHRMERELLHKAAWLSSVVRTLPDGVIVLDAQGDVQLLNTAAEKLLGSPVGEVIGHPFAEAILLLEHDTGAPLHTLLETTDGQSRSLPDGTLLLRDGSQLRPVEGEVVPVTKEGQPSGTVLTLRDATERIEKESRTLQKEKALLTGRLSAGLAQDFGGLLATVVHHSERLLQDSALASPQRQAAQQIHQAGVAGLAMARQLQDLHPASSTDLSAALFGLRPALQQSLGPSRTLWLQAESGPAWVKMTAAQVEHLLTRLAHILRSKTPSGSSIRLQVRPDGEWVRLLAHSSAPSRPSWQPAAPVVDASHAAQSVEMTDVLLPAGGVWHSSGTPSREWRIEVQLPLLASRQEADGAAPIGHPTPTGSILVAEPQDTLRALLNGHLERDGYHTLSASSMAEASAIAALYDNPISLLLCNASFPEAQVSGLAARLRQQHPACGVLRVQVEEPGDQQTQTPASVLAAPFSKQELLAKVRTVLVGGAV